MGNHSPRIGVFTNALLSSGCITAYSREWIPGVVEKSASRKCGTSSSGSARLMEPFGASGTEVREGKPLKEMVGTRRLELLTSTCQFRRSALFPFPLAFLLVVVPLVLALSPSLLHRLGDTFTSRRAHRTSFLAGGGSGCFRLGRPATARCGREEPFECSDGMADAAEFCLKLRQYVLN